jgi:hypothetical protein
VHICAAAVPSTVATEIPNARTVRFLILSGFHPASLRALSKSSACTTNRFPSSRSASAIQRLWLCRVVRVSDFHFSKSVHSSRCRQIALSNSRNAVSLSSACTTKRFPLSRCASVIQIVWPLASRADTQPQLQPALLSLSAMISQYFFLCRAWLLSVEQPG